MRLREQISIRRQLLLALACGNLAVMLVISTAAYLWKKQTTLADMDQRLTVAATLYGATLPPGYHDRITGPASVSEGEFRALVRRNDDLCRTLGLEYLWSLMEIDGRIVFTSATSTDKAEGSHRHAAFFEEHSNPELYTNTFATLRTTCHVSQDKWGSIRAALVPGVDALGRKHLHGASMRMAEVHRQLMVRVRRSARLGLLTFGLSMVIGAWISHRSTRSLRELAGIIRRTAAGERDLVADEQGTYELSTLARLANQHNQSLRERVTALQAEGQQRADESLAARQQAAADLSASEARYRTLVSLAVDGILVGSDAGAIIYANERMCDLFGLSLEEILGKNIREMPFAPESLARTPFRYDLLQKGEIVVSERLIRRPDGSEITIEMRTRLMPDGTYQSIYRDITERIRSQEQLAALNATLEQRVAERTEEINRYARRLQALTARMARIEEEERRRIAHVLHEDLQQILVAARMSLDVARAAKDGDASRRALDRTVAVLADALRVSRGVVQDIAIPGAGERSAPLALTALAARMREMFGLHVDVTCEPDMVVDGQALYVAWYRAVQELLFNVAKHADVARATVRVRRLAEGSIETQVRDEGRGIVLKEDTDLGEQATGLGLFGLRERIEELGGSVRIDSREGKGTAVTVVLPAGDEPRHPETAVEAGMVNT